MASNTLTKEGGQIDRIINRLNARWDLQIPHLHGDDAKTAAEAPELARRCSSRIRSICCKSGTGINAVITDFEDRAAQKKSSWVYKRGQESGTLPSSISPHSALRRDATSCARSNPEGRSNLLQLLSELLDDEYQLYQESEDYMRVSFSSTNISSKSATSNEKNSPAASLLSHYQPSKVMSKTQSCRTSEVKSSASSRSASMKREAPEAYIQPHFAKKVKQGKTQLTLSQTTQRQTTRRIVDSTETRDTGTEATVQLLGKSSGQIAPTSSFESRISEKPPSIFSDQDNDSPSSNDTSFSSNDDLSGAQESHFSGGTELEHDFLTDPAISQSFYAASPPQMLPIEHLLNDLHSTGPLQPTVQQLPSETPFWYAFELHRLSLYLKFDVNILARKIRHEYSKTVLNFREFWDFARSLCKAYEVPVLQKSKLESWTIDANKYENSDLGQSVYFSARLDFVSSPLDQLFELKLMPIEIHKSCRFHRRWSADRFMVLDIPVMAPNHAKTFPASLLHKIEASKVQEAVCTWLTQNHLHIAGRVWRAFYVEHKAPDKKKKSAAGMRLKLHLFAVDGLNFSGSSDLDSSITQHVPSSLDRFVQWHTPWSSNLQSTDLKLFARMHLGLSKTIATIVLNQSEFIEVGDVMGETQEDGASPKVMSDGCARISRELATAIWEKMGRPHPKPSAFQARIGGAKGLWVVDYQNSYPEREDKANRGYWIEISESQLKIKPHPAKRHNADPYQRTFEVVKTSQPCKPAALNNQLISILENRCVPRESLEKLMVEELNAYYESLTEALADQDPTALRAWRQNYHRTRSAVGLIPWCGSMPGDTEDELDMLLEAGFRAEASSYLRDDLVRGLVTNYVQERKNKLWIRVPKSTNVFCVPDFQGILEPDEVQLNPSVPLSDETELDGEEALVSRNPAHLPSDMQKVKFVHDQRLRHIKDVIIFSTKGSIPLADKLSGGDYDGDTVIVIWDARLVQNFENAPLPQAVHKADCGVTSKTELVKEYLHGVSSRETSISNFMLKCISINSFGSRLGEVTKFLEKLDYGHPDNKTSLDAIKLAALAGWLVDAPKQGDYLDPKVWDKMRGTIAKKYRLQQDPPAYDGDDAQKCPRDQEGKYKNILDFLKFGVGERMCDEILTKFEQLTQLPKKDKDLCAIYDKEWKHVQTLSGDDKKAAKASLKDLREKVDDVYQDWYRRVGRIRARKELNRPEKDPNADDYAQMLEELSFDISRIEPLNNGTFYHQAFERHGSGAGRFWSLLRASCVYSEHWQGKFAWKVIGDELCRIKADAELERGSKVRSITGPTRDFMKLDTKKWATYAARRDDDMFGSGDDEYYGTEA